MIVVIILFLLSSSFLSGTRANEIFLYVSPEGSDSSAGESIGEPFATIQKARDAIRQMKKEGTLKKPVTVYIRDGLYELSEPIIFTPEDSGTESCPITYTAYKDENPVISGGRKIAGTWKDYKDEIKVCTIDEVKKAKWNFRQLFADGNRQTRARIPNEDYFKIEKAMGELPENNSFEFKEGDCKTWENLEDVEAVIFHSSNISRLFLSELNEKERIITFSGSIGKKLVSGRHRNHYYIENVLEGLDRKGEWYLDRHTGKLYYWPVEAGQISQLRAPVLHQLVRLKGNIAENRYVQYLNFTGLTFSDAGYLLPEEGFPTLPDIGDIYRPSAITFEGTRFCTFKNNSISNVGTYALEVTGEGNHIIGNEIYDAGGGGIISRSFGKERNEICYNHIHNCGQVFHGGVGIYIDDEGGLISHNLIHNVSQSGVYIGKGTTDNKEMQKNNREQELIIESNEIRNVMEIMNDGAGIFAHGSNILIRGNVIYNIHSYGRGAPGWGIALGCDTENTRVENNLVYRTREGLYIWDGNKDNTIENNIFVDTELALVHSNNPKDRNHENVRLIRNIFYYSNIGADLFKVYGERSAPAESDYNIFWNPSGCIWTNPVIWGMKGVAYFEDWLKKGFDKHSTVKDPLFVDKNNDDYSLKPNSPAFNVGFKPFDVLKVGLRGK
ncbi:MAG TPA: right-handed parallel beta-helix repeat-containing protein [bacterium]|nr:right-handed parallel beta-helix repeat-containing protein [bacterium]